MELASTAFLILMGVAFGLATLLGIIWGKVQVHSLVPLALWVTVAGGICGLISLGFWTHNWINNAAEAPVISPAPPVKSVADKAGSLPKSEGEIIPITPQSAQHADVPDASSDNRHETTSAAPDADARPPHEIPTPEYIANILSEYPYSYESRKNVTQRFTGKKVAWNGRIASKHPEGDSPWIIVNYGLEDQAPHIFFVRVELPEHESLLLHPNGTPIHIDGTIVAFNGATPELKITTAKVLPATTTKT